MGATGPFRLVAETIGPLPILNHFLARLRIDDLLRHLNDTGRNRYDRSIGVLLRNLLLAREPLYGLADWAASFRPDLLGLSDGPDGILSDDQVGRALDRLFDADRASLQTAVVVRAITEFRIDCSRLHNDTTSVMFSGQYAEATGEPVHGKPTVAIIFGYSKDHRPDLKQLLWSLTVSADGAVPVHYKVYDGNTNDTPTHRETWDALRELLETAHFLYVGDSKLCAEDTLQHIDLNGEQFLTVLPRTRKEDGQFRTWVQQEEPAWVEVAREENPRHKLGPPSVWKMAESPIPAADGFRLVWVWNSAMAAEDLARRQDIIGRAVLRLQELEKRLQNPRSRYRSKEAVAAAAERVIREMAQRWVGVTVTEEELETFRQERRGRPGKNTTYRKERAVRFHVAPVKKEEAIAYDARSDGMFPLLTNCRTLPLEVLLGGYRFQPRLEKRFEQMKTVYAVAPMLLKKVTRIEALLFVYFLALLVEALIEREIRRSMEARGLETVPLYPEGRPCEAPTTGRVLELFTGIQVHRLRDGEKVVQVFGPELTEKQRLVLGLLGVPEESYTGLA